MKKSLVRAGVEGIRRILYLPPALPEVAQIEITNRCNFNCLMCQRFPLKVPLKDMDFELYRKIIDKLEKVNEVILTGWGEPLMHPKLVEMVEYAKGKGKFVSLTSNGSLLVFSLAQKLMESRFDSISFSLDDIRAPKEGSLVHPVTTQIKNIENFMRMIKGRKENPEVIIQSTLHKNQEDKILEVVKWGAKIGADMVNVNRLDLRFQDGLKRPNLNEEKEFVQKLEKIGKQYQIQTEFRPHVAFSGLTRKFYQVLAPFMQRGGQHCLRVYNYVYVNISGEVTPCCGLPLWSAGNILKDDLKKIWKSQKFHQFRQHDFQRKICGKCDVLEIRQWT